MRRLDINRLSGGCFKEKRDSWGYLMNNNNNKKAMQEDRGNILLNWAILAVGHLI